MISNETLEPKSKPVAPFSSMIQADVPTYTRVDVQFSHNIGDAGNLQVGGQNLLTPYHLEFIPEAQVPPSVIARSIYARFTWRF